MVALKTIKANGWTLDPEGLNSIGKEALGALSRVYPEVVVTRLHPCPWLAGDSRCRVHLKMECEQVTQSFKLRGAINKVRECILRMASLPVDTLQVVTCSSGNHALAVLHACQASSTRPRREPLVYLPTTVSASKREKLEDAGASLVLYGEDTVDTELEARKTAMEQGLPYVSPYNDIQIAGGQGTVAFELLAQLPSHELDAVFVPVGGGGLISGVASVSAAYRPKVKVVGCQPENSCIMVKSVRAGRILNSESSPTLSEGTAGGVEEDAITFGPCVQHVDEWVTVSEAEIASVLLQSSKELSCPVEGAAAMAMACFVKERWKYSGKNVVVICCGGNVGAESLKHAIQLSC